MGLEIINIIKKEKGMTSKQLSEKSKVPIGTLNKILNGQTKNPAYETIFALAKALDCSVDMFCDKKDTHTDIPTLSKEETTLLESYNKLDNEDKNKVVDYTKLLSNQDKYKVLDNSSDEITATKEDDEFAKVLEARKKAEQYFKENPHLMPIASHDKEGNFTEEDYKHDMDIMMNDDLWK